MDQLEGAPQIGVEIAFHGVSSLHQSFFSDVESRARLGRNLAGLVTDPARLSVAFDSEAHLGTLQIDLGPQALRLPIQHQGDTIRLADIAPVTVALASYRSAIAARYDYRIQSFRIHLLSVRGLHSCLFSLTGGNPPDGRTLSPCVTLDGEEHCGEPGATGVRFTPEVASQVRACLDL